MHKVLQVTDERARRSIFSEYLACRLHESSFKHFKCGGSALLGVVPDFFSLNTFSQPAAFNRSICVVWSWSVVLTRAYPTNAMFIPLFCRLMCKCL